MHGLPAEGDEDYALFGCWGPRGLIPCFPLLSRQPNTWLHIIKSFLETFG